MSGVSFSILYRVAGALVQGAPVKGTLFHGGRPAGLAAWPVFRASRIPRPSVTAVRERRRAAA